MSSGPLRSLRQPGPPNPERVTSHAGEVVEIAFTLEPGLTINDAIARPMQAAGIAGGTVEIEGGALGPFAYVMPALSVDARFAAYYSASFHPTDPVPVERGNVTFGEKDGLPFIHCHAIWQESERGRRCGHVMPHETVVAEPIRARAWGLRNVAMRVIPDAETNFALFTPVLLEEAAPVPGGRRGACVKIQPNRDVSEGLEEACRRHGFARAVVRGSIGSLVGADFTDGRHVPSIASELLVLNGLIDAEGGSTLDVAMVDVDGAIHEGRLVHGRNPACITFELFIEEHRP
ncbi:PCC domain-containing protein [Marinivivus vitaminiproducens]|uniref:PCC domain-containing protein n=1 Tax=Marinivivus vitaminiproducens TaxID=3035935 RepID=UPI00279AEE76|nr:DUF296 domain-containing protein [Geminicoccaceae bacterium SCSIO 64248]